MISNKPFFDLALDLGKEVVFTLIEVSPLSTQRTKRAEIFPNFAKRHFAITVHLIFLQPPMNITSFKELSMAH
jgi:hypothetical protein